MGPSHLDTAVLVENKVYIESNFGVLYDHNSAYHVRRFVLGETDSELQQKNIEPGTWDTPGESGLPLPLTSVTIASIQEHQKMIA
jgi:hypothetical protein